MTSELVKQDCDAVDGAAALEVRLNLLWGSAIVDVSNEDAARVNIFSTFAHGAIVRAVVLHLSQLRGFSLHLLNTLLHRDNLILLCGCLLVGFIVLRIVFGVIRHGELYEGRGAESEYGEEDVC